MRTNPGWHGYWLNPGDAGLPMDVQWQLPKGFTVGPLALSGAEPADRRRPHELRLRARLCGAGAAEGAGGRAGRRPDPRRRPLARLHRQDLRARAGPAVARPAGRQRARPNRAQFDEWRRALAAAAGERRHISRSLATSCASRSRSRPSVAVGEPYLFPIDRRTSSIMRRSRPSAAPATGWSPSCSAKARADEHFDGVLALGDGARAANFTRCPAPCPTRRHAARRARREGAAVGGARRDRSAGCCST